MVTALDAAIGKIVDRLKTTGQYNNTIIVFSSDSGSGKLV
jgi:arylsulfatase A-like enzyme